MSYKWQNSVRANAVSQWKNLKYGMFIHFGLFSLCGGMWNGKNVEYGYSEQILSHGPVPHADYEKLADEFSIENFDADRIASLAKDSGMNYIVLVTKHHDGFCLFRTATTDYSSANSPCHLDVVKEIAEACSRHGLKFGMYFSWIDWHFPYALPISPHNSDVIPPRHMQYNIEQLTELLSNYGPICELWMDMGAPTVEQSMQVAELAHRLQPGIMINGRVWNDFGDFVTMADNGYPDCELDIPWQTPATIYHETWGYRSWQKRDGMQKKIDTITDSIFNVMDGGGNYLLNIGLMGDGSIVPFESDVLLAIGEKIRQRGGLVRHPHSLRNADAVLSAKTVLLEGGTPHFRYSGSDYYSLHKIVTAYSWVIEVDEDGWYDLGYALNAPLEHEQKLCIDIADETFIFPMKRGKSEFSICSSFHLEKGKHAVSVYTPGPDVSRPEFPELVVKIKFNRL